MAQCVHNGLLACTINIQTEKEGRKKGGRDEGRERREGGRIHVPGRNKLDKLQSFIS